MNYGHLVSNYSILYSKCSLLDTKIKEYLNEWDTLQIYSSYSQICFLKCSVRKYDTQVLIMSIFILVIFGY